jgi:glucan 1,3-beta-glucosidase
MAHSSFLCVLTSAALTFSLLPSIVGFSPGFPYGSQKVRGVNLGGWLLLEVYSTHYSFHNATLTSSLFLQPWITPSLFDGTGDSRIIDEWTFCQFQNGVTATNKLRQHWDTFITERDFAAIAAAGCVTSYSDGVEFISSLLQIEPCATTYRLLGL